MDYCDADRSLPSNAKSIAAVACIVVVSKRGIIHPQLLIKLFLRK